MTLRIKGSTVIKATTTVGLFSPNLISGLQAWYDASDSSSITLSSTEVTQWNDKSASSFNVTPNGAGNRPSYTNTQNGRKVVTFTTGKGLGNSSATALRSVSGWTIFTAFGTSATTTAQNVFVVGVNTQGAARAEVVYINPTTGYVDCGGRRLSGDSYAAATTSTNVGSDFNVWTGVGDYTNTTATLFKNGTQVAQNTSWLTAGSTANDWGSISVGAASGWLSSPGAPLIGSIGEIVVYNSVLSTADRQRVEAYLKTKWATP